ncbi:MAG: iron-sulfur cluster assembly accessory protein [Pseudomonadales bacterium]|jgi:Fe-S cluster assembly protein SufA|uniref:HesB/IscA family protein n=1 Tax=unclassified Ketobacter TaxID=2639109 RepID=UPI000C90C50D|nr:MULTISPECIES: iron-sulfur cluster assembly accessory protein [unclassified Ketobacter]MAQ23065.1 iron-sulfur cluster assembly accessory protein [Pseudomonadales bacterium]MEC8813811.1 iron-sulfur cluster assembly accessory protein [Pseudomonadota bacterium]TNC88772.1 MAG: iron-sulfur cluster assembly accessory protein [Alcanivorax sp.]HAG96198.1 iron-sulfur cluster assembly accessory protein [Gammaproteobacteria bacterium]MAQ23712.1 iron-sulfur cluster assembly accessory protein [Pseudomona|tara:strand:+ start:1347 stop:1706 length:360 start_codon:yes stop_codon:yes gene_type:complete
MTVQTFIPENSITLTPAAIAHMAAEVARKDGATAVRIAVKPSGCSGFMYEMELVDAPAENDLIIQASPELTVYVDQDSLPVLQGTELDYVKQGLNAILQFRNPNATSECGCGESFSVTK